jgi:glycosyltransferase involved in cell wall biosynthesis
MPKRKTRVSILMSVYNGEKYLEETLQSILKQDFKELEVIVVDDGSEDSTYQIMKELSSKDKRIKILKQRRNKGKAAALNRAIEKIRGEYIIIFDADDIMYDGRISAQIKFLENNPKVDVVYGNIIQYWEEENKKELYEAPIFDNPKEILEKITNSPESVDQIALAYSGVAQLLDEKKYIPTISLMLRKKIFDSGIKFDSYFDVAQDTDFLFQIICRGFVLKKQDIITVIYRRHPKGVTYTKKEKRKKTVIRAVEKLKNKIYFGVAEK